MAIDVLLWMVAVPWWAWCAWTVLWAVVLACLIWVWRDPDMTAAELSEALPGRTPKAIRRVRERYGRWRTEGVVPLCQRCGEHPVHVSDPQARRWGLCRECAQSEKDWRDRNAERLERENAARRQRKHKRRGRE